MSVAMLGVLSLRHNYRKGLVAAVRARIWTVRPDRFVLFPTEVMRQHKLPKAALFTNDQKKLRAALKQPVRGQNTQLGAHNPS